MIINTAKATEAAKILDVELDALTLDGLTKAYRTKARDHHPDSADKYDAEAWARTSWAKEVLVRWIEQGFAKTAVASGSVENLGSCRSCGGTGRVAVTKPRGFGQRPVTMMCVMCNGSGEMPSGGDRPHSGE